MTTYYGRESLTAVTARRMLAQPYGGLLPVEKVELREISRTAKINLLLGYVSQEPTTIRII